MVPEKKQNQTPSEVHIHLEHLRRVEDRASIVLKPFTSDYGTFVSTTRKALGLNGPVSSKVKPSRQFAWLTNSGS
jgi:hypothetical protein